MKVKSVRTINTAKEKACRGIHGAGGAAGRLRGISCKNTRFHRALQAHLHGCLCSAMKRRKYKGARQPLSGAPFGPMLVRSTFRRFEPRVFHGSVLLD